MSKAQRAHVADDSAFPHGPGAESARLANRAAALSFAAAFAVIVALVTFSKVLDETSPWTARLAAALPTVAAVLLLSWAARARMRWSSHRAIGDASGSRSR